MSLDTNGQNELRSLARKTNRPQLHLPMRKALGKPAAGTESLNGLMDASQSGDVGMQRTGLRALGAIATTLHDVKPVCELLIYRLDGRLSVIFVTELHSDNEAIKKADEISRYGYRVEIWRNGIEVGRGGKSSQECANVVGRIRNEGVRHRGK
jgi:hypothetical protein